MIDLSVILVSYNTAKLSRESIESFVKWTKGISYEFIVVDNASKDKSVEIFKEFSCRLPLKLIKNTTNVGFGKANNQGMKMANGRYILLLNSDTKTESNVLGEMVLWMDKHPRVGVSTCCLKNRDGSLQGTGGYFPTVGKVFAWMFFLEDIPVLAKIIKPYHPMHPHSPLYEGKEFFKVSQQRDWVTGAFFLLRKETYEDVGSFDEDYFMYVEEVDYCFRVKKKDWQVWYLPKWSIIHYGGEGTITEFPLLSEYKGIKIFYKKHMPKWQHPVVKFLLKSGALLRIPIFGILKGKEVAAIYAKAYKNT